MTNNFDENDEIVFDATDELEPLLDQEEDYTHGRPLLSFNGPSDLPVEENRRWFALVMTVCVVLVLLSIAVQKSLLALILCGVAVLTYMLSRLPNQDIENVITSTGFFTRNKFYPWSQLNGFWIIKDNGHYVLGLETNRRAFSHEMILLGNQNPLEVKQLLTQFIPHKEDHKQDSLSLIINNSAIWLDKFYAQIFARLRQNRRIAKAETQTPLDEALQAEMPVPSILTSATAAMDPPVSSEEAILEEIATPFAESSADKHNPDKKQNSPKTKAKKTAKA